MKQAKKIFILNMREKRRKLVIIDSENEMKIIECEKSKNPVQNEFGVSK